MEHTPAPWKVVEDPAAPWGRVEVARKRWVTVEGLNDKEAKANANLIAAAPELLDALDDFVKYCQNDIDLGMININPELQQGIKAINKAKGLNK